MACRVGQRCMCHSHIMLHGVAADGRGRRHGKTASIACDRAIVPVLSSFLFNQARTSQTEPVAYVSQLAYTHSFPAHGMHSHDIHYVSAHRMQIKLKSPFTTSIALIVPLTTWKNKRENGKIIVRLLLPSVCDSVCLLFLLVSLCLECDCVRAIR